MKILHVNFGLSGFVGDTSQGVWIAKYLQEMGHKVTIVTTDADIFYYDKERSKLYSKIRQKLLESKDKLVTIEGIETYPVHCITPKMGMYCPSAARVAREILPKYDVVHIFNWYHHLGMVFSKVAYDNKIPFFVSAFGSLQSGARSLKSKQKWLADQMYTKKMIVRAAGLHSVGDLETGEYVKMGAEPEKIFRIDHGIIMDQFKINERTDIFNKIGIQKEKTPYLLYLSRIDKKKGIELLLAAFARLSKDYPDFILVIAGSGTESYEQEIKQKVKDLGIENRIKFTGLVSYTEKLELLESATLFVLTSHSDVHPIAVQEALTMGTPVVITKSCDYPEVDEYNAGITVNGDVDSAYNAIKTMLDRTDKRTEFSHNAKKLINEKFLLQDQVKKYEKMYLSAKNQLVDEKI